MSSEPKEPKEAPPMKPRDAAVLQAIKSKIDSMKIDVPDGEHKVGNLVAEFTLGAGTLVTRDPGTAGDGWDKGKPEPPAVPQINPLAVLLFLEWCAPHGQEAQSKWLELHQRAKDLGDKTEVPLPVEAAKAFALWLEGQPKPKAEEPKDKKCPANTTGAKRITYKIRRVQKAAVKKK